VRFRQHEDRSRARAPLPPAVTALSRPALSERSSYREPTAVKPRVLGYKRCDPVAHPLVSAARCVLCSLRLSFPASLRFPARARCSFSWCVTFPSEPQTTPLHSHPCRRPSVAVANMRPTRLSFAQHTALRTRLVLVPPLRLPHRPTKLTNQLRSTQLPTPASGLRLLTHSHPRNGNGFQFATHSENRIAPATGGADTSGTASAAKQSSLLLQPAASSTPAVAARQTPLRKATVEREQAVQAVDQTALSAQASNPRLSPPAE
jgi:hypothetical protein